MSHSRSRSRTLPSPRVPLPLRISTRAVWFVSLLAAFLTSCASAPAGPSVRRVFLSKTEAVDGLYDSDMQFGGASTDRFDAQQSRGYLYVVFNDHAGHVMQFTIRNTETGASFTSSRMEFTGTPKPGDWRTLSAWFRIAGRLSPGGYVLDLTVDGHAVGQYPFTVTTG